MTGIVTALVPLSKGARGQNWLHDDMITIDGKPYPTVQDAAEALGVSTRAVGDYIRKGIIDQPPSVPYGLRDVNTYPPEYIEAAKHSIREYRAKKRVAGKARNGVHDSLSREI